VNHFTTPGFWELYDELPPEVRELADKNYELLKNNPRHPSLHFKPVGDLWSVRIGLNYRALGAPSNDGIVWYWIGPHKEYETRI